MRQGHHHHQGHHLHPPHTDATPTAQLGALGLGVVAAVTGPVGVTIAAGAASIAGAAWLVRRARSRDIDSSAALLLSRRTVELPESEKGPFSSGPTTDTRQISVG